MSSRQAKYNRSEKGKARAERYRQRQIAKGLCRTGCGRPLATADGVFCNEHMDARLTPERMMRKRRREALLRRAARHQTTKETPVG